MHKKPPLKLEEDGRLSKESRLRASQEFPEDGKGFAGKDISIVEFVILIGFIMGVNALGVDVILPAFPHIASSLQVTNDNHLQALVTIYLAAMGVSQLIYGPLADRFGRRMVLFLGLIIFIIASYAAIVASQFSILMAARALQGVGVGSLRVVAIAVVRDRYSGAMMSRVVSIAMVIFFTVPIFAPSVGQLILFAASWQWVFGFQILVAIVLLLWTFARLPETLAVEQRIPLSLGSIFCSYREVLRHRCALRYMLVMGIGLGIIFAFVSSSPQVFMDTYGLGPSFTLFFAVIAFGMSVAFILNSILVKWVDMLLLVRVASAAMVILLMLKAIIEGMAWDNVFTHVVLQTLVLFTVGFLGPNLQTLAMHFLGHIGGTASAMGGFLSVTLASALGFFIARFYDGTVFPITLGSLCFSVIALAMVLRRDTSYSESR